MGAESVVWRLLGLAAVLVTAAAPLYGMYDLFDRGPSAEKRLQLMRLPPINPMRDLSALRDRAAIVVTLEEELIDNLLIAQAYLRNIGRTPIVPSDYHEHLSVSVGAPWKIVAVENQELFSPNVQLRWHRVSDTRFEAEPALLNPGDSVAMLVYLTNTESADAVWSRRTRDDPQITWSARITNLRAFSEPPDIVERMKRRYAGIVVFLSGWGLPFTIVAALVFHALYLHLLVSAEFLRDWSWRSIGLIVGASLLSFSAAECIATYLFGGLWTDVEGVQHHLNAPPIVLHAAALAYLWWKTRAGPVGRTV